MIVYHNLLWDDLYWEFEDKRRQNPSPPWSAADRARFQRDLEDMFANAYTRKYPT